jgi:Tfp pilus assembly protein PilV
MRCIIRRFRGGSGLGPKRPVLAIVLLGLSIMLIATVANADDSQFIADSTAAMNRMMTAMQIQPSGNADSDFVAMMVPHHQGAIDMARAELLYGQNETLRRMAQEIIVTQQSEIVAMQQALGQSSNPSPTGPGSMTTDMPAMADQ